MSLIIRRTLSKIPSRLFYTSSLRCVDKDGEPEQIDYAQGLQKKELMAYLAGEKDPYTVMAINRNEKHAGTKEDPNLVPSAFESRIVGCICSEDSCTVLWMWLHQDEPKRCWCGHWFKLYYKEPFSEFDKHPHH